MAKWICTQEVVCANAERGKGFVDWYKDVHLNDVLETPGFLSGKLYEIKGGLYNPNLPRDGRGQFIEIYEIETDDIDKTMQMRQDRLIKEKAEGRHYNESVVIWHDVLWRETIRVVADKISDGQQQKWVHLTDIECTDASREEEFNDWYDNVHVPDALGTMGFFAVSRYEEKEHREGRAKFFSVYNLEGDDIEKVLAARRENIIKETAQGRASDILKPLWWSILWKLIIEKQV